MSGRRRRTTSTTAAPAKAAAPPKPAAQPVKPAASSSSKAATPAQLKPTPPPPAQPTPSARLRREWKSFEGWLRARREEKNRRIGEKLKEVMSTKAKSRFGRPVATSDADIGAFEDRLNQELAEQARAEWLKRVAATGLNEEDWTDITEEEMEAVEAAFIPQERAAHPVTPDPPPPAPVQATSSKPPVGTKSANARNPYAATVEEEPTPPGAWEVPSKAAKGTTSRTRAGAETPIIQRIIPTPLGSGPDKPKTNGGMPTAESLWEMHMNKQSAPAEPEPTESLWDLHGQKTHSADGSQSSGSRWSPYQSTPPTSAPSSKLPTPELLWEMHHGRSSPKQPPTPAQPTTFPLTNKLREKLMGEAVDPFAPPAEPEPDNIWEAQTKTGKKNGASFQRPASVKPQPSAPPVARTPAPAPAKTPVPPRAPVPSKPAFPSKLSMSLSDDLWDTPATLGHPSLHTLASELPTPVSSTYTGNYNYISPVFLEMEEDEFPREDDPLPEAAVEETIRRFHASAAEMEIALRRTLLSGTLDESGLEQLLGGHIAAVEASARKVLEEWQGAREAVLEERAAEEQRQRALEEQRRADEQRQRLLEEQRKRQADARKLVGKKKGKWALPIIEDVAEEPPAVEPALQGKRKPAKKGVARAAPAVVEEAFRAKAATPVPEQEDDGAEDLWQPKPKAPAQVAAAKSMFSFFGKPAPSPAPGTPVPTPWTQTQAPARAPTSKPPPSKNPFAPAFKANNAAPEREMTPWEAMLARKQEAAPVQQPEPDLWGEENTDESEDGVSWTQMAVNAARGGAASAWDMTLAAVGGERAGTAAPRAAMPAATAGRESLWGGGDMFARSESRAAWGEEPSGPDPRFSTWKPPRRAEPEDGGAGGATSVQQQMADLAFQNLFDVAEDGDSPNEIMNAMSMYSKAMATSTRKRGGSNAHR